MWYFIQMLVRAQLPWHLFLHLSLSLSLCYGVILITFCYSFHSSAFWTTVLASSLIPPKRWFWNYFIGFLKYIKMIDLIRQIHILKIWDLTFQHWILLAENNIYSMELSGHKDHKLPPICLGDVFFLQCVVLHCPLLSSLGELFVQQVLCIVNCHMHLCSYINNEQFCTHRHCDSYSNNI